MAGPSLRCAVLVSLTPYAFRSHVCCRVLLSNELTGSLPSSWSSPTALPQLDTLYAATAAPLLVVWVVVLRGSQAADCAAGCHLQLAAVTCNTISSWARYRLLARTLQALFHDSPPCELGGAAHEPVCRAPTGCLA